MRIRPRALVAMVLATALAVGVGFLTFAQGDTARRGDEGPGTTTPIKHVVVIFDENESFDHYFGTYPDAANTNPSEPSFTALPGTPSVNNYVAHPTLLTANLNANNPARFARSEALGCGNSHDYSAEQRAFDGGAMDKFVENTGGSCGGKTMNYFDGNTVTGLWNLAQHFTMSDNFFGTTFGPSTPGAINLVSGNTNGALSNDADGTGTLTGDPDPVDDCGNHANTVLTGKNIGDRLNEAGVTWGWFQGGFRPTAVVGSTATCGSSHKNVGNATIPDYSAHHEPFQYYASTGNPHHLPPTSADKIGQSDQANHQYDLTDFDTAMANGNMPQVSFLKAAAYEDAHPGNSDPVDEQRWIARVVDEVQNSPEWDSTAIMIAYDDSDGWYDHAFVGAANIHPSKQTSDALNGAGVCGTSDPAAGDPGDRCGPGPRLPFLIVSPWVSPNTVHTSLREQTAIIHFIEDNWTVGQIGGASFDRRNTSLDSMFDFNTADARAPKLFLDPSTGEPVANAPAGSCATGTNCPQDGGTSPTASPTTSATASPSPTASSTPPPGTTGSFKPKVSCKAKRSHGKVKLTCTAKGVTTAGKIKVKASLLRGKKTVGTGSGSVKKGKLSITVKHAKHAKLRKGRYTLKLRVTQGKRSKTLKAKLKLK